MPAEPSVRLRPASAADAERLRAWRNEPEVVAESFSGAAVGAEEHREWLARTLADPAARLCVVEADGEPVGQVRLTPDAAGTVELHVALTAAARGRGIGRRALALAVALASGELGAATVVARVKPANEPSLRAFAAAGFAERERSDAAVVLARRADG